MTVSQKQGSEWLRSAGGSIFGFHRATPIHIGRLKCLSKLRHTFLTRLGESGCDAWTRADRRTQLCGDVDALRPPLRGRCFDGPRETRWAQNWAQVDGVNPSVETIWNWHTCRSMILDRACNKLL